MKRLSFYLFILGIAFIGCNTDNGKDSAKQPACPSLQNGIDTSIYKITFNKNGNLILAEKSIYNKDNLAIASASPKTDQIRPIDADTMIATHIGPDVDMTTHKLGDKISKSVVFSIDKLIGFYNQMGDYLSLELPPDQRINPDSMKIYFGVYNQYNAPRAHPNYKDRMTCILVGMRGGNDIRDEREILTYPINIGTLCPPNCDYSDFGVQTKGAIYLKKGAVVAKATSW